MGFFSSDESDEPEYKEYTEHTAEIHYANGDVEEVVFDAMRRYNDAVILKNYTGATSRGFDRETFATISMHNVRKIETKNREKKNMEVEE